MSFGSQLKALRRARGWTQGELGAKAMISVSFISDMERDKAYPSLPTLITLAVWLKTDLNTLVDVEPANATPDQRITYLLRQWDIDEMTPLEALNMLNVLWQIAHETK